ncbi:hypothetical protein V6N11_052026 [Hibiscus sabdariffa]|uniref:Uncharacterized protein n=1 Tax=Hibiscus sabdariffa TaxID=183260 RepID=A0ABR2U8W9_9ROSI
MLIAASARWLAGRLVGPTAHLTRPSQMASPVVMAQSWMASSLLGHPHIQMLARASRVVASGVEKTLASSSPK